MMMAEYMTKCLYELFVTNLNKTIWEAIVSTRPTIDNDNPMSEIASSTLASVVRRSWSNPYI